MTDIKIRREELGLDQRDIAEACGVAISTVSRWESGDIENMKRSYIVALAKALKVSPLDILDDEDSDDYIDYPPEVNLGMISESDYQFILDWQNMSDDMKQKIDDYYQFLKSKEGGK